VYGEEKREVEDFRRYSTSCTSPEFCLVMCWKNPADCLNNAAILPCPVWHRENDLHQLTFEAKGYVVSALVAARALLAKTVCD